MLYQYSNEKFYVFKDNEDFVVTTKGRQQIKVFRGTEGGAHDFIARHPYGMTKAQAKAQEVK